MLAVGFFYSKIPADELLFYDFLHIRETRTDPSVCEHIFTYMSYLVLQTNRCSWRLFSAVVGSRIFSNAQNVTTLVIGLRRSSSIASSHIDLIPFSYVLLFAALTALHRLNFDELLCFVHVVRTVPNFYIFFPYNFNDVTGVGAFVNG